MRRRDKRTPTFTKSYKERDLRRSTFVQNSILFKHLPKKLKVHVIRHGAPVALSGVCTFCWEADMTIKKRYRRFSKEPVFGRVSVLAKSLTTYILYNIITHI